MDNKQKKLVAIINKNIREICQYELQVDVDFYTITDVWLSSDHSYCRVFVSFFTHPKENVEKLNKVKGFVRSELAHRLDLRRVPEVEFILDDGYEKEKHIDDLLNKKN